MADFPEIPPPNRIVQPTLPSSNVRTQAPVHQPDNKGPQKAPKKMKAPEIDGYSLSDISAEGAGILLGQALMQEPPPPEEGRMGLASLKTALEKVRDGEALSEADNVALSLASDIVNPMAGDHPLLTGAEAYKFEEGLAHRDAFNRAAAPYASPRGVTRA